MKLKSISYEDVHQAVEKALAEHFRKQDEKQRVDHYEPDEIEIKRPPRGKIPPAPPLPKKPEGQKDTCVIEPIKTEYLKPESKKVWKNISYLKALGLRRK